jgi:radical SAM superfamily enzyme YgiQ (UPF0313 family)
MSHKTDFSNSISTDICLVTLNSTYKHAAFGLRYLYANLGQYQSHARIFEFVIQRKPEEIAEQLLAQNPKIIGFGVYIWNTSQTLKVIELIKAEKPEILIVLGGPEVSYETQQQKISQIADYVICGEADFLFYEFCDQILGRSEWPAQKIISGSLPDITKIKSPYLYYDENDIKTRIIYVEASRGCPYKCEYCLSSLDKSVRNFPIEAFLSDLQRLIDLGVRQFKFIDRTFNLSPSVSTRILQFFLDQIQLGLFLHFEMVPDRLPLELKELIRQFPAGSLQFEIGVQTWNPQVAALVSRRQDYQKVCENLLYLKSETKVHTHVDLIAGLPGESLESFAAGFDKLASLAPDEVQVGVLKRLKGTPIIRHDREWSMRYSEQPPFQILENKNLDSETLMKIQRFSKYWDLIANSGNFKLAYQEIYRVVESEQSSLFQWFWKLTDFLDSRHATTHSIPLIALFESMLAYFNEQLGWDMKDLLREDYQRGRSSVLPKFLRGTDYKGYVPGPKKSDLNISAPKRQLQHLAGS